ncbi:glycoside hydrolase [Paraphoma chrysanthemicola]|nr:glycoside hydrolase [Paraphoma chrysanthemicola]
MRSTSACILALASAVTAHYQFPELIVNGQKTGPWTYVRKGANYQSNGPLTDISSNAIRCYETAQGAGSQTYTVKAGDSVGFTAQSGVSHPGPLLIYMARVPAGQTAAAFDGSGSVWFKVHSEGATFPGGSLSWVSNGKSEVSFTLPKSVPSGEYLVRVEHIALHGAYEANGAQFYLSCAQIKVEGGGSGNPGPLVSFPGAYKSGDAGISLSIYYPPLTSYTPPGPPVWQG